MTLALTTALEQLATGFSGVAGIAAERIGDGERVSVRGEESFPTASTIKIFVLYELLRRAERQELDLDEHRELGDADRTLGSGVLVHLSAGLQPTLADLAVLMMMVSDNTATNLLIDRLGVAEINAAIRAAGLGVTTLGGRIDFSQIATNKTALGVATPLELVRFLARMRRGELLSGSERYFDVLRIQKYIEPLRRRLPANPYAREFGEPEPVWVASKTGSFSGVRCECGLVHAPHAEWAIAVMTKDGQDGRVTSENEGVSLIAEASRLVFEAWGLV